MTVKWNEGITVTGHKAYRLLLGGIFGARRRDYWKFNRMVRKAPTPTWVDVSSVSAHSEPASITLDNTKRG